MMKGYLYKEWKQNRHLFLLTAVIAMVQILLPILLIRDEIKTASGDELLFFTQGGGVILQIIITIFACVGVLALQELIFRNDDMKSWGLFVASNPKGIKGYIFTKYSIAATLYIFFFALSAVFDCIFAKIAKENWEIYLPDRTEFLWIIALILLLLAAIEIPFVIRFGMKLGNTIKLILVLSLFIIGFVLLLTNLFGIADAVFGFFANLKMSTIKWCLPFISFGALIMSSLLSCKLYMKGVFQYYR